jgi:hypothetical protein
LKGGLSPILPKINRCDRVLIWFMFTLRVLWRMGGPIL